MFTIFLDLDVFYDAYLDTNKQVNPFATKPLTFLEYFGKTTYQTIFIEFEEEQDVNKLNLLMQFQNGVNENAPKFEVKRCDEIDSVEKKLRSQVYSFLFLHQSHYSNLKASTLKNNLLLFTEKNYLDFIKQYDFHEVVSIDKDFKNGEFEWNDLLPKFPTTEIIIIDDYIIHEYYTAKLMNNFYALLAKLKHRYSTLQKLIVFTQIPEFWSKGEFSEKIKELISKSRAILGITPSFVLMDYKEKKEHDRFILANYFRIKMGTSAQFLGDDGRINNTDVSSINSDSYYDYKIAEDAMIPLNFAKEKLEEKKQTGKIKDWVNSKLLNI